jgi:hypothetical protein
VIRNVEIRGGADALEAAVIAVVIDRIAREEEAARHSRGTRKPGLPAWVRALSPETPNRPRENVYPD